MTQRTSFLILLMLFFSAGSIFAQKTVRNVGVGQTYTTIQAAINAASSGDIINIINDYHQEANINVNKNVTIQGQGASVTTLRGNYVSPTSPGGRIFVIQAGYNVTIQDLYITKGGANRGADATVAGNNGVDGRAAEG